MVVYIAIKILDYSNKIEHGEQQLTEFTFFYIFKYVPYIFIIKINFVIKYVLRFLFRCAGK